MLNVSNFVRHAGQSSAWTTIVPAPYSVERIISFNWFAYRNTSRSFGFVGAVKYAREIFLGTDFRVTPVIINGRVELGNIGQDRNSDPIQPEMVKPDAEVVIEVVRGPEGLWGRWCFKTEWDATVKRNQENLIAAERERNVHEEAVRRQMTDQPRTLEQALSHGWEIQSEEGRQVIVFRMVDGKKVLKTFHRPKTRKMHLAKERQCIA